MNRFYVYAYLRSKDSVTAKAGTPYYIGKGCNRRMFERHIVSKPSKENIVILFDSLLEIGAFILERNLIRWFGRKDIKTGILHNRTDGGDGASGRIVLPISKKKSSIANSGQKRTEKTKKNIKEALALIDLSGKNNHFFGKEHTEETKEKMSAAKKGKTYEEIYGDKSNELKEKRRKQMSERIVKEETKNRLSAKLKGVKKKTITCPYCNKEGGTGNMKRHNHIEKCRIKSLETSEMEE